ncbi:MAG: hypothetical protein IJG86_00175 [Clostridia bacterium]|nr:hypothetical protein [Clostridia bacterium]
MAPATKEQEKKALEKIRKIVADLGADSYIGIAFEGCFEDAEENIENDWMDSMKGRWQVAEHKIEEYKAIRDELVEENRELKEDLEFKDRMIEDMREKHSKRAEELERKAIEEKKEVHLELTNGETYDGRFAELRYTNNNGFTFITVIEPSGWTTSYKMDDIKELRIS